MTDKPIPWKRWEDEKPERNTRIMIKIGPGIYGCDVEDDGYDDDNYLCNMSVDGHSGYDSELFDVWIYEAELLETLPGERHED